MVLPFVRFPFEPKRRHSLIQSTLRLFIAFAGYFVLGAYYNYTTYGATGVDLIPCVSSMFFLVPILKPSSLTVDIETFGAKYHTCYETLSRTFVVLSSHDKVR